jgi:hypothetical protein
VPTVTNTTKRPLAVPLPQGKKLHLGPGRSGEVTPKALEHPPFQALVEDGSITVQAGGRHGGPGPGDRKGGGAVRDQTTRGISRSVPRRTGDG